MVCLKASLKSTGVQHVPFQTKTVRGRRSSIVAMAGIKKVNSYDEDWEKGFFGTGIFLEDRETSAKSPFKKIEEKKLLSSVEKLGLLSKLEAAGITLSKIEQSKLLSTAEKLGALELAEKFLVAEPAAVASSALPFVVLAVGSAALIPHDNTVTTAISYSLASVFAGVATVAVAGGFFLASLQEE